MLDSVENMIYNGVDLSDVFTGPSDAYFIVNEVRGRGVLSEELELLEMPGHNGTLIMSKKTPERVLEVDITLKGESFADLRKRIERLDRILRTDETVPIVFADEPDRTYMGTLGEVSDRIEQSRIYQATLTIVCPRPYKYGGEEVTKQLTTPYTWESIQHLTWEDLINEYENR